MSLIYTLFVPDRPDGKPPAVDLTAADESAELLPHGYSICYIILLKYAKVNQ